MTVDGQGSRANDEEKSSDPSKNDDTTIIAWAAGGSAIVLTILIVVIGLLWRRKSSLKNSLEEVEVDENHVYGIYSEDPADDYCFVEDTNMNYEASDL